MQGLQHDWVDEQDLRTRVRNNTLNIVVDQLWAKLRDPVWPSTYDPPDRTKSLAPEYSDPMIEQRVRCMLGIPGYHLLRPGQCNSGIRCKALRRGQWRPCGQNQARKKVWEMRCMSGILTKIIWLKLLLVACVLKTHHYSLSLFAFIFGANCFIFAQNWLPSTLWPIWPKKPSENSNPTMSWNPNTWW